MLSSQVIDCLHAVGKTIYNTPSGHIIHCHQSILYDIAPTGATESSY